MPSVEATTALATEIAEVFASYGKTWNIGGVQTIPTPADVQAVLEKAKWEVEYQAVNSHLKNTNPQLQLKHLMFKQNEAGNVEVFVKMGEIE